MLDLDENFGTKKFSKQNLQNKNKKVLTSGLVKKKTYQEVRTHHISKEICGGVAIKERPTDPEKHTKLTFRLDRVSLR